MSANLPLFPRYKRKTGGIPGHLANSWRVVRSFVVNVIMSESIHGPNKTTLKIVARSFGIKERL